MNGVSGPRLWLLIVVCVASLLGLGVRAHSAAGVANAFSPMSTDAKMSKTMSLYASDLQMVSKCAWEDFSPDGNLDKDQWRRAAWQRFDHDMTGQKRYPEAETEAAALWTPANLYLAFRARYTALNLYEGEDPAAEKWKLWERDVVEAFINPAPDRINHYYEFEVSPNNLFLDLEIDKSKTPFNDPKWDSRFEHATHIDSQHHIWTCEMRIPVASMGAERISAGQAWRINLFRADGFGDDSQRRLLAWSLIPTGKTFHAPERFGRVRFEE
jgi:hypothetical protein